MTEVEELTYDMSFKWDKKTFDDFGKNLGTVIKNFAVFSAGISAAVGAGFALASSVANTNDELVKNAKRLNIATEEYQKFKFAAELGGAGADDLSKSLESLTKAQEDVLRGKGDLEAWGQLGINPADFENSSDLLLAISDRISTIQSDTEKINLLERIGIPRTMLQTLENGSAEIIKLGKEFEELGGITTEEQKKMAQEFNDTMTKLGVVFTSIKNIIGSNLLKPFMEFADLIIQFAKEHMAEIIASFKSFFDLILKSFKVVVGIVKRVMTTISGIIDLFGGLESTVIAVGLAFVALKFQMLLAFAIPLAIATALFLIIEDIVKGLQGQDSITKDLLEDTGMLGDIFRTIVSLISTAAEGWSMFFDNGEKHINGLKLLVNDLIDTLNMIPFVELGKFDTGISAARPQMGGLSQAEFDAAIKMSQATPLPQTAAQTTNSANVNIVVNGATDPRAVAKAISSEFQKKTNTVFGGSR